MQNNEKKVDFTNQNIHIGIDVHKKNWNTTIYVTGKKIKTFSMDPNPEKLAEYLGINYPNGNYISVYEAGFCGFWIHRGLEKSGINNIIVNPADVPTSNKEKTRKTDPIDSNKLARELSNNNLTGIYIPTAEQEAARALCRLRDQYVKIQTGIKNRIKSLINLNGDIIPENHELKYWSRNFIAYLEALNFKQIEHKIAITMLIETLLHLRSQIVKILKELRQYTHKEAETEYIISLLETVPGVGFVTAISFFTEIIDINRFRRFDELCSFVGLAPSCYSSGEKERTRGITKRRNAKLRNLLIEAAWIAICKDPAMTMKYAKLRQRLKPQQTIIRIAKKLLSRIMAVWTKRIPYSLAVVE